MFHGLLPKLIDFEFTISLDLECALIVWKYPVIAFDSADAAVTGHGGCDLGNLERVLVGPTVAIALVGLKLLLHFGGVCHSDKMGQCSAELLNGLEYEGR